MIPIIIFAVLSGLILDILVGLLGSRRNIGFGWAFIISVISTPIIGLVVTLLSARLPEGAEPRYGCLGKTFGCLGVLYIVAIGAVILCAMAFAIMLLFPIA